MTMEAVMMVMVMMVSTMRVTIVNPKQNCVSLFCE